MSKNKSVIESLLFEAQSYNNFEDIEKLLDQGVDLSAIPIQPLYLSLRNAGNDVISKAIVKMSKEQRQSLLDLDLWEKDTLDVYNFYRWPQIYNLCSDEKVRTEFSQSTNFLLFIKSRLNAWTFDVEEPEYPDHDYYFLTEDSLLLIEYDKDFPLLDEVKNLIKQIYSDLGVENAYSLLFKILVESQMVLQEDCYQEKISRLRDFGFVDYYDSLELRASFVSYKQIRNYILQKTSVTANLDTTQKMQALHSTAVKAYVGELNDINNEINKLSSDQRSDYIRFNFIRLVNASISLNGSLKKGIMAISRTGKSTKQKIELGFQYIQMVLTEEDKEYDEGIFESFDFNDLYKVGNSLIELVQKKLKKNIVKYGFDSSNDYFLGEYWERFLDDSYAEVAKLKTKEILTLENFHDWKKLSNTLCELVPFITQFKETLTELIFSSTLNSQYYLNYSITEMDFEPVILSAIVNYDLDPKGGSKKMGVTIKEFQTFYSKYFSPNDCSLKDEKEIDKLIEKFSKQYGLEVVSYFADYIKEIIDSNYTGIAFDKLEEEEFKHVGGILLLV